ncbi:MAG: bacteriocin [Clostridiales bacterium]|nr:bacteriocin [Candidatus Equinaster intestinalis]
MKAKEESNSLKDELEALNKKPEELTEEELKQIVGGTTYLRNGKGKLINMKGF